MGPSDSSASVVLAFRLSTYSYTYRCFNSGFRAFFPRTRLPEVSRGHINHFPFMPTLITTRTLGLLLHATPQEH